MSEWVKLIFPLEKDHRLVRWANAIRAFYGHPVYLVGSQLTDKEEPRDVDIVVVLPDKEFELRYGSVEQWEEDGNSGIYTDVRWIWSDECVKKSLHGMKATGLLIDFKVWPHSIDELKYYIKTFAPNSDKPLYPKLQIDTRKNLKL